MVAGERFLMLSKTDGNSPTLCISRGRVYAHMRTCANTYYACKCKKIHAKPVQKTAKTQKNLLRNFFARRLSTKKTSENAENGITSPP